MTKQCLLSRKIID